MTSNEILKADFLDILFDSRNKTYGAYALRKNYNFRLEISLLISVGTVFLVLFFIRPNHYSNAVLAKEPGGVVVKTVAFPKKEKFVLPKQNVQASQKQAAQETFTRPKITEDIHVTHNMVDQKSLISALVSDHTVEGPAITGPVTPVVSGTSTGGQNEEVHAMPQAEMIQREPEFPGGTKAWLAYLTQNLRSPGDLEPGEKKTVLMRFLVSAEGEVTGFEVVQSGGRNYDNEVIRVLKKMPRWKPAIQNGQPVSRSFTQPVTFMGLGD
jgi:protein TonB